MNFTDVFRLASRIFKNNRLRTFLTILGIAVGVGAIVFLVTLGYGLQKLTVEKITQSEALLALDVQPNTGERSRDLTIDAVNNIRKISGVDRVEPALTISGQAVLDGKPADLSIIYGVGEDYFSLDGISFYKGSKFSNNDTNKIVVSRAVLNLFGLDSDKLPDKTFKLSYFVTTDEGTTQLINDDQAYQVSGVVIDQDSEATVYLPYQVARRFFPDKTINALKVKVKKQSDITNVKEKISAMGFPVSATIDMVDQLGKGFKAVRIILGLFGIIALVVASIGMFNTMTISLLERIKEVGIMKALGAADRDIYSVFMAEAVLIGFFGGLGGLLLGYVGAGIVNLIFNTLAGVYEGQKVQLFSFPLWFVISILLFSCVVAFITGIYPARRAARLDPLQALRYE